MKSSYWPIEKLPGLNKANQEQLKSLGINNSQDLLKLTQTKAHKQHLANQLKCQLQLINKWVALADLGRVPSVGYGYCGLILHSGIISVNQLAQTPVGSLHRQILKLQVATLQQKNLCPSPNMVQTWINEAKVIINNELKKI